MNRNVAEPVDGGLFLTAAFGVTALLIASELGLIADPSLVWIGIALAGVMGLGTVMGVIEAWRGR